MNLNTSEKTIHKLIRKLNTIEIVKQFFDTVFHYEL